MIRNALHRILCIFEEGMAPAMFGWVLIEPNLSGGGVIPGAALVGRERDRRSWAIALTWLRPAR